MIAILRPLRLWLIVDLLALKRPFDTRLSITVSKSYIKPKTARQLKQSASTVKPFICLCKMAENRNVVGKKKPEKCNKQPLYINYTGTSCWEYYLHVDAEKCVCAAKTAAATTNQPFNQSPCTDHHPNCFKENYTLLYFILLRSPVINAVVSDAALQTHTEPQWRDCLSASAVSSTSFRSKSSTCNSFHTSSVWKCAALHHSNSVTSLLWAINQTHTHISFLSYGKSHFQYHPFTIPKTFTPTFTCFCPFI